MPIPSVLRSPCVVSSCSVALEHVTCEDRMCLKAEVRLYVPSTIQPHGAASLCNAAQCIPSSDGNSGGVAVLVRSTNCVELACKVDRNGISAIEADLMLYVPPVKDPNVPDDQQPCIPGENAASCVPNLYDQFGQVTRRGGLAVLVTESKTIKLSVRNVSLCSTGYKQIVADIILNPCEQNAIVQTDKGLSLIVGKSDCMNLYLENDAVPCSDASDKVLKAEIIIADDPRNVFNCTKAGATVMVRGTDCVDLVVVSETVGGLSQKWLEASLKICDSPDNATVCSAGGLGTYVGTSCTIRLQVEPLAAGCSASKVIKGYIQIAPGWQGATNLTGQGAGGLGSFVRSSTCIAVVVAESASGTDENGCSGAPQVVEFVPIVDPRGDNAYRCGPNGMRTLVHSTSCVEMKVGANSAGEPSIQSDVLFSGAAGNAAHCRAGCGGGSSGLAVVFRNMGTCVGDGNVTFELKAGACGGTDIIACVAAAETFPGYACNGLVTANGGMAAPPNTTGDTGHVGFNGAQTLSPGNTAGTEIAMPQTGEEAACNTSTCRNAIGLVIVRAPHAQIRVKPDPGQTGCAYLSYAGEVGYGGAGGNFGDAPAFAGLCVPGGTANGRNVTWTGPFEVVISGQTEVFRLAPIPPGQCVTCKFSPNGTFGGSGQREILVGSYSVDCWVFSIL